jgi:3-oxoacyl-[acyl-carrier protein] reductase
MGRATADRLLAAGWTVLALDQTPGRFADAPGEVREFQVDVTDRAQVETAIGTGLEPGRSVDLVANIAGIYPPSTLRDFTEERYRRSFDVNVLGVLNVAAASLPHLASGSSIVNFASVDAFAVSPGQLLYGAAKAAVVMLTKELALELAPRGVRVNAIAPGWVDTPGNRATGRMAAAAATIPLGRVAQPAEFGLWVRLLGGPDAAFLTGETLVLSGGGVLR